MTAADLRRGQRVGWTVQTRDGAQYDRSGLVLELRRDGIVEIATHGTESAIHEIPLDALRVWR